MKRPSSLPVLVQVGALVAAAVIATQAVTFAVVVLGPDPRPDGFSVGAAAAALKGEPAQTQDGRPLTRRLVDRPPNARDDNPMSRVISALLARELGATPERVRVVSSGPRRRPSDTRGEAAPDRMILRRVEGDGRERPPVIITRRAGETLPQVSIGPGQGSDDQGSAADADTPVVTVTPGGVVTTGRPPLRIRPQQSLTLHTRDLAFGPFTAAYRLDNGRWAVVEPPRGLLSPWQQRLLLTLGLSVLILAPLVWWMARRLTRPIRAFAQAAERLGDNPEAPPLDLGGPAEVRTAVTAFNDMQASIRVHMRQRTQTIAAIAHDLRTPLTRLRFRAEQAPEAVRDRMAADIEEMDHLIAQAMAFVRGETAPDLREAFDLADLAADCVQGFAETGADVVFHGQGALPVMADAGALRRALTNLIGNAVKFGGGARVTALAHDGAAVITVEDDGPGLANDELELMFEPFQRGERSRNRETGGAGLGLTVARTAARAADGDVVLLRRDGGGLAARLHLPLASGAK